MECHLARAKMTKTCLLTGGSRGIGAATAELLRARGWEMIAPTRAELDFVNPESVSSFSISQNLDAVVFCHGEWYSRDLITEQTYNHFHRHYFSRVFYPLVLLVKNIGWIKGGSVMMVSSTRGFIGGVNTGPYALACAAQIAMMQGYAREYQGVRFNCVCPGLTDTAMGQNVIKTGGAKPGAAMQPPGVVAAEIVRLIESDDNGRVMRVVNSEVSEAKWSW